MGVLFKLLSSVHVARGDWCACGERANACFVLSVLIPGRERSLEQFYNRLFEGETSHA